MANDAQDRSNRVGRGTRWTEDQVSLLLDTVKKSGTAKEAFEIVADKLGKSTSTVQQKYYALQRKAGGSGRRRRGRPRGAATTTTTSSRGASGAPGVAQIRELGIDELVGLARSVKEEVDRRRRELDEASSLFG